MHKCTNAEMTHPPVTLGGTVCSRMVVQCLSDHRSEPQGLLQTPGFPFAAPVQSTWHIAWHARCHKVVGHRRNRLVASSVSCAKLHCKESVGPDWRSSQGTCDPRGLRLAPRASQRFVQPSSFQSWDAMMPPQSSQQRCKSVIKTMQGMLACMHASANTVQWTNQPTTQPTDPGFPKKAKFSVIGSAAFRYFDPPMRLLKLRSLNKFSATFLT